LKEGNIPFAELGGVHPNPRRSLVEQGIKHATSEKVDFLLASGGGSTIDTAKAIALALANNGEYWKFYNGTPAEKSAPVGAIHTIAAAGSETSRSTVLVDDIGNGQKRGAFYTPIRPVFALMNPELTYSVSPYQTGAGATDIFAHTMMRYFSRADSFSFLGDAYGEATMRTVVKYGPIAVATPDSYEARSELMLAASFSHNDLTGIGRTAPFAGDHTLEQQISGHYDTPHGAGLAVLMPAMLRYIADHGNREQLARVAQFGVKVFGADPDMADLKAAVDDGLCRFRAWLKSMGKPLTLKELGIPQEDLPEVIRRCLEISGGVIKGYLDFDRDAITAIYTSVVE
jgi:alcohol dehydrogenase YqhD (iron-dependent ADH family)